MLLSSPQMQQLVQKNPELRHALADPQTLQLMLRAAVDPTAQAELMRNHDRAMANLETIPEGFSHLKRVYSAMQEPLHDIALAPKRAPASTPAPTSTSIASTPVPNPWARGAKGLAHPSNNDRFATQLATMHAMGFADDTENIPALLATNGHVQAAVDWILAQRRGK